MGPFWDRVPLQPQLTWNLPMETKLALILQTSANLCLPSLGIKGLKAWTTAPNSIYHLFTVLCVYVFFKIVTLFLVKCICLSVWVCACEFRCLRKPLRISDYLELELQVIVEHLIWVLRTQVGPLQEHSWPPSYLPSPIFTGFKCVSV